MGFLGRGDVIHICMLKFCLKLHRVKYVSALFSTYLQLQEETFRIESLQPALYLLILNTLAVAASIKSLGRKW